MKRGEIYDGPVVFGDDGHFHPVKKNRDGHDIPNMGVILVTAQEQGFKVGGKEDKPHNELFGAGRVVEIQQERDES